MVQTSGMTSVLCKKDAATYCLSVPLFVHFSFSPSKVSVTDFSVPLSVMVFKLCIHLVAGQVYCEKEKHEVYIYHFAPFLFFFFHLSLLCNAYGNFSSNIS